MIKMSIYFALLCTVSADIATKSLYVAERAVSTESHEENEREYSAPKYGIYRLKPFPKSGNCYVILSNGDRIRGTFLKYEKSKLYLSTETFGDLVIPSSVISKHFYSPNESSAIPEGSLLPTEVEKSFEKSLNVGKMLKINFKLHSVSGGLHLSLKSDDKVKVKYYFSYSGSDNLHHIYDSVKKHSGLRYLKSVKLDKVVNVGISVNRKGMLANLSIDGNTIDYSKLGSLKNLKLSIQTKEEIVLSNYREFRIVESSSGKFPHKINMKNDDLVQGEIVVSTKENTSFRSHLGDFRVPTGRIKSVIFRDLKQNEKQSDLLILSDNLYLSGEYLSEDGLFRSLLLGDLLINNKNISIVDWRK